MATVYIRHAVFKDLFPIEQAIRHGLDEGQWVAPAYDPKTVLMTTIDYISRGLVFVACEVIDEKREKIVGTLMLRPDDWQWAPGVHFLTNLHFYVIPEYRSAKTADGRITAAALVDACQGLAEKHGIILMFNMMFGDRAEAKDVFIERQGMTYLGGNFIYVPESLTAKHSNIAESKAA